MRYVITIHGLSDLNVPDVIQKLLADGWVEEPTVKPGPTFHHPAVQTEPEARLRLRNADLDPDDFHIDEHPDDRFAADLT